MKVFSKLRMLERASGLNQPLGSSFRTAANSVVWRSPPQSLRASWKALLTFELRKNRTRMACECMAHESGLGTAGPALGRYCGRTSKKTV